MIEGLLIIQTSYSESTISIQFSFGGDQDYFYAVGHIHNIQAQCAYDREGATITGEAVFQSPK